MARYMKAVTAFVAAFAVPFAGALTATSDQGNTVTQGEWITALVAGLVGGFAVAAVPNRAPKGDAGVVNNGILVTLACAVIIIVGIIFIATHVNVH